MVTYTEMLWYLCLQTRPKNSVDLTESDSQTISMGTKDKGTKGYISTNFSVQIAFFLSKDFAMLPNFLSTKITS